MHRAAENFLENTYASLDSYENRYLSIFGDANYDYEDWNKRGMKSQDEYVKKYLVWSNFDIYVLSKSLIVNWKSKL